MRWDFYYVYNKEYLDILISFINAILKRDNPITSVELLNTDICKYSEITR